MRSSWRMWPSARCGTRATPGSGFRSAAGSSLSWGCTCPRRRFRARRRVRRPRRGSRPGARTPCPRDGDRRRAALGRRSGGVPLAGRLSAIGDRCAHQNGPLGEGRVLDGCVTRPWRGFRYRLEDGCAPAPSIERLATYRQRLEGWRIPIDPRANPPATRVKPLVVPAAGSSPSPGNPAAGSSSTATVGPSIVATPPSLSASVGKVAPAAAGWAVAAAARCGETAGAVSPAAPRRGSISAGARRASWRSPHQPPRWKAATAGPLRHAVESRRMCPARSAGAKSWNGSPGFAAAAAAAARRAARRPSRRRSKRSARGPTAIPRAGEAGSAAVPGPSTPRRSAPASPVGARLGGGAWASDTHGV
jgi:nitrite reductase/ring-hydroxylating ferredoxin subunit